jgi:hypothetical protein
MVKSWFVKHSNGDIQGPFTEAQIRSGFELSRIDDSMQVRQDTSDWKTAAAVRRIFQVLSKQGFYLRTEQGRVFGPFTKPKVLELNASKQLPMSYWIRRGDKDVWTPINSPLAKLETKGSRKVAHPVRTPLLIPAAPVMKLRSRNWLTAIWPKTQHVLRSLAGSSRNRLQSAYSTVEVMGLSRAFGPDRTF